MNMSGYGSITKVNPQSRCEGWRFESVPPPEAVHAKSNSSLRTLFPKASDRGCPKDPQLLK